MKCVTFLDVYEKFLKERQATVGTEMEFETVVKRFIGICGNKALQKNAGYPIIF